MKKVWTYIKDIFSSDPSRCPKWVNSFYDWLEKDSIWFYMIIVMLIFMYTTKLLAERIETLEYRIKRVEEPVHKKSRDVALASDMINLEHVIYFNNHINSD